MAYCITWEILPTVSKEVTTLTPAAPTLTFTLPAVAVGVFRFRTKRAVLRVDGLFCSALSYREHHLSTSPQTWVDPSGNGQNISKRAPRQVDETLNNRCGATSPPLAHHGAWLLWGLYAKFAERFLDSPRLAFDALEQAGRAALTKTVGPVCPSRRCLTIIARAQLCQRWPGLKGSGGGRSDNAALEGMFVEVTSR